MRNMVRATLVCAALAASTTARAQICSTQLTATQAAVVKLQQDDKTLVSPNGSVTNTRFKTILADTNALASAVNALSQCLTPPPPVTPPPPPLTVLCPIVPPLTAGTNGTAVATYSVMPSGGTPPYSTACTPISGSAFPVGTTPVACTTSDAGNQKAICNFTVTVTAPPPPPPASSTPYGGTPWPIPGVIQAENFDDGGEGLAYHDDDAVNSGGAYRQTGVDIESASEGGYDVGWTDTGEWLQYTVNVPQPGTYPFVARVASAVNGAAFHLEVGGVPVGGMLTIPNTGGWQTWTDVAGTATLRAGVQSIRVVMDAPNGNYNAFTFGVATPVPVANGFGVAWDPETADGFIVSYGTAPGTYTNRVDVGSALGYALPVSISGQTYFFVVQAYLNATATTAYQLSATSAEVSGVAP